MPKVNPFHLVRPKPREETRSFTDPDHEGVEVSLTLRAPNVIMQSMMQDRTAELVRQFCVPKPGMSEPDCVPLPGSNPEAVPVNRALLAALVALEQLQVQDEADRYTWLEWLALALNAPRLYEQVTLWANGFIDGDPNAGNSSGAGSGVSSSEQPSATDANTQPSPSGITSSSAPSMTGSDTSAGSEPPSPAA